MRRYCPTREQGHLLTPLDESARFDSWSVPLRLDFCPTACNGGYPTYPFSKRAMLMIAAGASPYVGHKESSKIVL